MSTIPLHMGTYSSYISTEIEREKYNCSCQKAHKFLIIIPTALNIDEFFIFDDCFNVCSSVCLCACVRWLNFIVYLSVHELCLAFSMFDEPNSKTCQIRNCCESLCPSRNPKWLSFIFIIHGRCNSSGRP